MKAFALMLIVFLATALSAHGEELTDYGHARKALEAGRIVPLAEIFIKVESLFEGEVLEVQLDDPNFAGNEGAGGGAGGTGLGGEGVGLEDGGRGDLGDAGTGTGGEWDDGNAPDIEDISGEKPQSTGIIYVIKLLTPQGNVLKIEIDAKTAEFLNVSGRGADLARKKH